ncbi:helix-turn-helix domain-containing protein [Paenibacillus glycanilyticus]|uniref:HTH araC/xylS-type domain-containing protein n=1 Tax=Paenibacillus glycanilyticus TaxID=126569 RepID=A0ABQ6G6Y0_9BACL|nr:helix-turn-helix domain-containing protein [Paenibacillus glycanilyticus]GLX66719.1 hypothetical protein MU1_10630 [Paenibacillus glycanilyticus]
MPGSIKQNSMFVKQLLALTAIAVITVVLIATVTYSISADNSIQNAITYNESVLTQQQELIHKELTSIKYNAAGMISTQSYLYQTKGSKLSVSSLIDLTGFVAEQKKISPYIDSVYVYYEPLDLVLTSRQEIRTSPISTFADQSWLDLYKQPSANRSLWITGRKDGFAPDHQAASLLQKMPLIGQVNGAIVINLKLDLLFNDYLSHYHNKKGTTLVLGANSELLYSDSADGDRLLHAVDLNQLHAANGSYVDDSDRIISYTTSELTGWKFIDVTEKSALLQGMSRIKTIVIAVAAVYLTAAIAISFFVSRRLYRPLHSVISYIENNAGDQREGAAKLLAASDEAGFIRQRFDQMIRSWETLATEKRQVDSLLTDNRTAIKEKYLNDLIQGGGGNGQAAELLGLRIDFSRFALLTLELEEPYPVKDDVFHFHLLRYGFMDELGADIDGEVFAKDDKRTVILLAVPSESEEFPLDYARNLKQHMLTQYGLTVTIAVSRICSGEQAVRLAYEETIAVLNLKIYIGKGEVLSYSILSDWKSEEEEAYYYPYDLEAKLQQALLQTDKEECFQTIREITKAAIDKKLSKANIQQLFFQLSGEIVKTLVQSRGDVASVFGSRSAYADLLARAETLKDMEQGLMEMCDKITDYHRDKRSKMTDVTLQLAIGYMDANFNNNISVDTVAEYVERSTSYLSRIFKESTGMTINDYFIQLRMKKAMEMLGQVNVTIEEICHEIGYANVSYFNKIFKSRTGLTPGQYRQQQAAEKLLSHDHI